MRTLIYLSFLLYFRPGYCSPDNSRSCGFTLDDTLVKTGTYVMQNILFNLARWELRPESAPELDKLCVFLKKNPTLTIKVNGYINSTSIGQMCYSLSQKRAQSVVDYLISKDISPERLTAEGYDDLKPYVERDANCKVLIIYNEEYISKLKTQEEKEAAHQKNRRIEIQILRNDYSPKPMIEGK